MATPDTGPSGASPGTTDLPLPEGYGIEAGHDLKTLAGGTILIGGAPLTITRLSRTGAQLVRGWFAGAEVSAAPRHQSLARRLIRSGMAHPCPRRPPRADPGRLGQVTVAIPVKDDDPGLTSTLDCLLDGDGGHRMAKIIVIDDGSAAPVTAPPGTEVEVRRNPQATGPGQARQRAMTEVDSPLVAFIDAGVLATPDDLLGLIAEFDDPVVVAAAPRVMSPDADHRVARYDRHRSPLDLGPARSLVGPGRQVPYVPSACLVVAADGFEQVGGFDPALRYGEDVDLIWRLNSIGEVRYQPSVQVRHPARTGLLAMANQRRSYGSAAGPLAERHGEAVAPTVVSPWSAAVFLLVVAGRPALAATTAAGTALALRPKIEPLPDLTVEAFLLTARGHWYGGLSVLTAVMRTWSPLLVLAWLLVPSQRRRLGAVALAGAARRLLDGPAGGRNRARDVVLGVIDDLSYSAGVWQGAALPPSKRTASALLPALMSWPNPRPRNRKSVLGRLRSSAG
jgi:mycofactocin system glycosyltransferase